MSSGCTDTLVGKVAIPGIHREQHTKMQRKFWTELLTDRPFDDGSNPCNGMEEKKNKKGDGRANDVRYQGNLAQSDNLDKNRCCQNTPVYLQTWFLLIIALLALK